MNDKEELQDLAAQTAQYLAEYGWLQRSFGKHEGPRCAYGALSSCSDDHDMMTMLVRDLIGEGNMTTWNDKSGRTVEEVIGLFQDYAEGRV